jgi:hypothetical protein
MSDQIQTVWHGRGDDDSPVERGGSSEVIQSRVAVSVADVKRRYGQNLSETQ